MCSSSQEKSMIDLSNELDTSEEKIPTNEDCEITYWNSAHRPQRIDVISLDDCEPDDSIEIVCENAPSNNQSTHQNNTESVENRDDVQVAELSSTSHPKGSYVRCAVCLLTPEESSDFNVMTTFCGHIFCEDCMTENLRSQKCPICRKEITLKTVHRVFF